MPIMDYMSGKATALLGILGGAALGFYIQKRRTRRAPVEIFDPKRSVCIGRARRIEIDDDTAAEIIRRARPALERAVEVYV